ncbi:hypothetical protein CLOM_g5796 [Closterium sp. NIES-68]|nr:hypothetical protein CLOM_g5796 [Closterium sp. NIES-68]GJP73852.1 hypothetical protein CLOP_g4528 [Closterium sp. NIES-67]
MDDSILLLLPDDSVNILQPDATVHVSDVMAMYPGCHVSSLDSDEAILPLRTMLLPGRTYHVVVPGTIIFESDLKKEIIFKKAAPAEQSVEDSPCSESGIMKAEPEPGAVAGNRPFKKDAIRSSRRLSALHTVEQAVSAFGACVDDTTGVAGDFVAEMAKRFAPDDDSCGNEPLPGNLSPYATWVDDVNAPRSRGTIPRSTTLEPGAVYDAMPGITAGLAAFGMAEAAMPLSGGHAAAHHAISQHRFASPATVRHGNSHAAAYRSRHRRVASQSHLSFDDGPANAANAAIAAIIAADNWTNHVSPAHPLAQQLPLVSESSTRLSPNSESLSPNGSFTESLSSGGSSSSSISLTPTGDSAGAAFAAKFFSPSRRFPSSSSFNGSSSGSIPISVQEDLDTSSHDSEAPGLLDRFGSGGFMMMSSPRREDKRGGKHDSHGKASLLKWFSKKHGADSNEGHSSHGRKTGSSRLSGLYIDSRSGTFSEEWC